MIHLTPEGKRYILEDMLQPKVSQLFTQSHNKDPLLGGHSYNNLRFHDLTQACSALDALYGWKIVSQIGIYDWDYTLLAVLTDEGSKPYDSFNFRGESTPT